jgi:tetratricopeptide (TPR) repeat protein
MIFYSRIFLISSMLVFAILPVKGVGETPAPIASEAGKHAAVELQPVPQPDLNRLEPAVAEQLRSAYKALSIIRKNPQVSVAEQFKAYVDLGRLYHAYEILAPAEVCYRNALTLSPFAFDINYLLARVLQQASRNEAALEAYAVALRLRPDYVATRLRMVEILQLLNQPQQARQHLDAVLQTSPDMTAALVLKGELALAEQQYSLAIELLNKALKSTPRANRLHYLLAQAYRASGQADKARQHLAQSGTIGVRIPDPLADDLEKLVQGERVYVLQGRLAYNAGDYKNAVIYFQRALEQQPDSSTAHINLGTSLVRTGDIEGAIKHFRLVLSKEPYQVTANYNLAELLLRRGEYITAAQHYERVLEKQPDDSLSHLGLARALRQGGKPVESFQHFSKVTRLTPQLVAGWVELAALLRENRRFQDAADVFEQAHTTLPQDGQIAHAYARFLASVPDATLRDGKRALDLAQRVFDASPTLLHLETLAMANAQAGNCDKAIHWQQEIVKLLAGDKRFEPAQVERARKLLQHYITARPCTYVN